MLCCPCLSRVSFPLAALASHRLSLSQPVAWGFPALGVEALTLL